MHNRLAVPYDITSYSEMITEILFSRRFESSSILQTNIRVGAKKERCVGSVSGNGTPIVFRP